MVRGICFRPRLGGSTEYRLLGFAALSSIRVLGTVGDTIAWLISPRSYGRGDESKSANCLNPPVKGTPPFTRVTWGTDNAAVASGEREDSLRA